VRARISTLLERSKRGDEASVCSKGGLSTEIHVTVDVLGNQTGLHLTAG
jgi:hypothetical protein